MVNQHNHIAMDRSFFLSCIFIIASAIHLETINIDLEPFNQKECITNCKHGLTVKVDRLILNGHVEIKERFKQKSAFVSFQWKNVNRSRPNYEDLQIIHFDKCTDIKRDDEITCTKSEDQKTYHFFLNVTAYEELSQAMMILKVYVDGLEVESKYIVLPTIHTLTEIEKNNWIKVWLQPFNQTDCITSCDTGLLADVDYLSLKAQVVFSESLRKESVTASFQWKNEPKEEYVDLKIIHLNQCSGFVDDDIYCTSSNSGIEYTIYLNMTANELLSEKKIAMNVVVGEMNRKSTDIVLPKILTISGASEVKLNLNGKELNSINRTVNFNLDVGSSYLNLCCESIIAPCYAVITPPQGPPIMGKTCATYESLQATTYKLGFTICGVHDYQEHITLHARATQVPDIEKTSITTKIVVPVVLGLLLIGILFIWFCCFKGRSGQYVLTENNHDNIDGTSQTSTVTVYGSHKSNYVTLSQSSVSIDPEPESLSNSGLPDVEADDDVKKELGNVTSVVSVTKDKRKFDFESEPLACTRADWSQSSRKVVLESERSTNPSVKVNPSSKLLVSKPVQTTMRRPSKKFVVEDKPGASVHTRSTSRKRRGAVTARKLNKAE